MNYNTNYTPYPYVDLNQKNCFCNPPYPPCPDFPIDPPKPCKPNCKNQNINIQIDTCTLFAFMIGYLISKK